MRRAPLLLIIIAVAFFEGMSSEGFDRLNVAHFLQDMTVPALGPLKPVAWFGLMSAVATLLSLLAMEVFRRRLGTARPAALARGLLALSVLQLASMIAFGLARGFVVALLAFWCVGVARRVSSPLYTTWLAGSAPPETRATVISLSGQMDALGQIAGGPVVGVIGTWRSLRAALVATGAVLLPSVLLYARALREARALDTTRAALEAQMPAPADPRELG